MNETYEVMEFGKLLERLLQISGAKNYALAAELGYDVSYISKWVNKSLLPSTKNTAAICTGIASFLTSQLSQLAMEQYFHYFHMEPNEDGEKLRKVMEHSLLECFDYSLAHTKNTQEQELSITNSHFSVNPRLQRVTMNAALPILEKHDMIIFTNLFLLGREDKLSIAGFDEMGHAECDHVQIMISMQREPSETIYDALLLIHMVTNYSDLNFHLYLTNSVPASLMLAVKNHFTLTSMLAENHRCIASNTCTDKKIVNELFSTMEDVIHNQGKKVLQAVSMKEMVTQNYYMQTIIAPGMRWLIGKITEQFLPNDLFHELLDLYVDDLDYRQLLEKNYMIMQNATMVSNISILLYESTLSKYILDGEMDFFGIHITLDIQQRQRHIAYMKELFYQNPYIDVRLVDGSFIEDFKKFSNPSIYLSDQICYIRIAKPRDRSLFLIKQKELMELYFSFFAQIWNHEMVCKDANVFQKKMDYYINCFQLFSNL